MMTFTADEVQTAAEQFDAEHPDWEASENPERFVPATAYYAATKQDEADLVAVLDWEQKHL